MSNKYIPTKWVANETIGTANVMNNIEQGIVNAHNKVDENSTEINNVKDQITEHNTYINNLKSNFGDNSINGNGYYKLPNGLLLQWGSTSNSRNSNIARVHFTIPYTVGCFNIQFTGQWRNSNNHFWVLGNTDNRTFFEVCKNNSVEVGDNVYWFAIGI